MEHKYTIMQNQKKYSPMVELHYASLNRAGGGGVKIFKAAFPHDFQRTVDDYKVDDSDSEVDKSWW